MSCGGKYIHICKNMNTTDCACLATQIFLSGKVRKICSSSHLLTHPCKDFVRAERKSQPQRVWKLYLFDNKLTFVQQDSSSRLLTRWCKDFARAGRKSQPRRCPVVDRRLRDSQTYTASQCWSKNCIHLPRQSYLFGN